MKSAIFAFALTVLAQLPSAQADLGVRHITCYTDFQNTVGYSGDYWVVSQEDFKPIVARKIIFKINGQCIAEEAKELPACVSTMSTVYVGGQPCTL